MSDFDDIDLSIGLDEMPVETEASRPQAAATTLTQPQKAAVVIGLLDEDAAKDMLGAMSKDDLKVLGSAMMELETVAEDAIMAVIQEFTGELSSLGASIGGRFKAKAILGSILSDDEIEQVVGKDEDTNEISVWELLSELDEEFLTNYLQREHPQTAAAILMRMEPAKVAALLEKLPPTARGTLVQKLAKAPKLEDHALKRVEQAMRADLAEFVNRGGGSKAAMDFLGAVAKNLPSPIATEMIASLSETDEAISEQVKEVVFTFSDIPTRVEPMYLTTILKKLDAEPLAKALKLGKQRSPDVYEFIIKNISSRFAEQIEESLEEVPRMTVKDAESAMQALMETISRLAESGEIKLTSGDDDEEFI